MTDNVRPLLRKPLARQQRANDAANLLADVDTILADIALDNPDLEPAGMHTAITQWRQRYRGWLAQQCGHPSAGGPDGGAA